MPVSFVGGTFGGSNPNSGFTLAYPAGLVAGDVLVLFVFCTGQHAVPAGWTRLDDTDASPGATYYRFLPSGFSDTSVLVTLIVGEVVAGDLVAYRGAVVPTVGSRYGKGSSGPNANPLTAPGVTNTALNGMVIRYYVQRTEILTGTLSIPAGHVSRYTGTSDSGPTIRVLRRVADQVTGAAAVSAADSIPSGPRQDSSARSLVLASINTAPNAPTLSVPSAVDRAQDVTVGVTFSDPDPGDTSSSSSIRFRRTDISPAPAWTVITVAAPVSGVTISGGTLAAAPYELQGQSRDAQGETSPWSASSFFTAGNRPPGPVFTSPAAGSTITTPEQTFTFSQPSLTSFEWRVVGDTAGAPNESVIINAGATVITPTGRSFTVTGLPNTTTIQTQVRVTDGGIASPWTSLRNLVSFTPPAAPTLALTVSYSAASIAAAITNPAPGAGQPTVISHDLYRREGSTGEGIRIATMLLAGSTYTDRTVASGVDYSYRVVSIATNGTTSTSVWKTSASGYPPGTFGTYTATYATSY